MKNIVIRIIISIVVILVISACSKDEEETITAAEHFGCKGSSSGSGPTIGGVTLKEATYKLGTNSFAFVNSTSANFSYSSGTALCYTIDVSSTTTSMLKTNSANSGNATMGGVSLSGYDNVTAYYMTMKTGPWDSSPSTYHMYIYADTDSTFYINNWGYSTKAQADANFYMKDSAYTKQ
jgi:hypothetical protein